MISFFKKLFGAEKKTDAPDAQIDFAVKDLQKGFVLDYDMRSWQVMELSTYTWDNGVKEFEYTIFDGEDNLYLGYAPTDNTLNVFWEGKLEKVWPEARQHMRLDNDMTEKEFAYEDRTYHYAGEGAAMIRNSLEKFEMQNWLFESSDQDMLISFNKYEDNTLGVYVGKKLKFSEVSNILPGKL